MLLEADSTTFFVITIFFVLVYKWWWWVGNKSNLLLNDREAFLHCITFITKLVINWLLLLRHCCSTLKLPQGLSFFFHHDIALEEGKKLEEEVICSHVCNFMIHDLIVIADVAQFFLQHYNPLLLLLLHKYNAANSLNLAVRQSRKTIIWKKEQVGDAHAGPNWGVFWLQGVMHIIQQPILAKQSRK